LIKEILFMSLITDLLGRGHLLAADSNESRRADGARVSKMMDIDQGEFRKGLAEQPPLEPSVRKEQGNYAELV
jgi:hypothetical protein